MRNSRSGRRFENVGSWDKKSEQQREEKKTGHRGEINAMTKGTKGTRKGQTKRKREVQKSDWGWRGKEIGGNVRASKTADATYIPGDRWAALLKNAEWERGGDTGGTEWGTEMIKCWLPFVYTCSTRPKHAYAPVNLIKAWYLTSRAGLAQVSARLFPHPCMYVCVCVLC